jgi:hypothetical protein
MTLDDIHFGSLVTGPLLPEPGVVLKIDHLWESISLIDKRWKIGSIHDPVLIAGQLAQRRGSHQRAASRARPARRGLPRTAASGRSW